MIPICPSRTWHSQTVRKNVSNPSPWSKITFSSHFIILLAMASSRKDWPLGFRPVHSTSPGHTASSSSSKRLWFMSKDKYRKSGSSASRSQVEFVSLSSSEHECPRSQVFDWESGLPGRKRMKSLANLGAGTLSCGEWFVSAKEAGPVCLVLFGA